MSLFTNAHTFCGGEQVSYKVYLGIKFQQLIMIFL